MAWDYYKDGSRVGPLRIRDRLTSGNSKEEVTYRCAWTCCGKIEVFTHRKIEGKANKQTEFCKPCLYASRKGVQIKKINPEERPVRLAPIAHDPALWYTAMGPLGKMGFRAAAIETSKGVSQ